MKRYFAIALASVLILLLITGGTALYMAKNYQTGPLYKETMGQINQLSCQSGILVDGEGRVIYEKNKDQRSYPASTTKILTVLVALEIVDQIGSDVDHLVTVPDQAVGVEGSSIYLKKDQRVTFRDLLYGAMLRSGNDAATAIAILAGGDLDSFVARMNEKANALGCKNSNFVNPTGLFSKEHYTTPWDMSLIARAAMDNETFREIAGAKEYRAKSQSLKGQVFINKNKTVFDYPGATGVKIGFTSEAGRTLVASAKRDNQEMIAIVFKDRNWFNDCYRLMDYGFKVKGVEKNDGNK